MNSWKLDELRRLDFYIATAIAFATWIIVNVLKDIGFVYVSEVAVLFAAMCVAVMLLRFNVVPVPIFAFFISFCLFYLGRPIAHTLGLSVDVYTGSSHWFYSERFSESSIRDALVMVVSSAGGLIVGVFLSRIGWFGNGCRVGLYYVIPEEYSRALNILSFFVFVLWISTSWSELQGGHYEKLYEMFISGGGGLLRFMQLIGVSAVSVALLSRSDKRLAEALMINLLVGVLLAILGQRGTLVTTAVAYSVIAVPRLLSFRSGIIFVLACFLLAYLASSIARPDISDYSEGGGDALSGGLMEGGATLLVLISTVNIGASAFDVVSPLHLILPFITGIKQIFVDINPEAVNYSNLLSYLMNPGLFFAGYGVGWSLLGDLYAVFGGDVFLVFLSSFLLGALFSYLLRSEQSSLLVAPLLAILPKLLFLPRASLSTIFPLYWQVMMVTLLFIIIGGNSNKNHR